MQPKRSLLAVAAAMVASSSVALAQGPCVEHGWCHFAPLVQDPLTQGDYFGGSVDVRGDVAVVGSLVGGKVSVLERIEGAWQLVQVLEDPHAGINHFGWDLALSEDFIAVGAPTDSTSAFESGAVHVYRRAGGAWVLDETLLSSTPEVGGNFGLALDVDGIWLAIGAPREVGGGRVHVHMRTFSWWFELTQLATATSGELGHSVVVSPIPGVTGAQIAVGDPYCGVSGSNAGRVSILHVQPFAYVHEMVLPPTPEVGANFGSALDFDGTMLVVASDDASGGGAVDVFVGESYEQHPMFALVQRLAPCSSAGSPVAADAAFGHSVALDGDRLAIGVPGRDQGSTLGGAAELFRPNPFGAGFVRDGLVFADGAQSAVAFGWCVALDGETLLVGDAWGESAPGDAHGAVYPVSFASKSVPGGACPCDCVASAVHYGTGKPGTNGVPTLEALSPPVPGEKTTLRFADAFVGAQPILVWGLVPAAVPFDGCTILVEDLHLEFLPTIGVLGQVGIAWNVPSDPATCGLDVFVQAFMFDPGASGVFALAHTDGLQLTVGY